VTKDGGQTALEIAKSLGHKLIVQVLAFYTHGEIEEEALGAGAAATGDLVQAREETEFWKREMVYRVRALQETQQQEKATAETQLARLQEVGWALEWTLSRERREAAEATNCAYQDIEEVLEEKQLLQDGCGKEKRKMEEQVNNIKREAKDKENKKLQMQKQTDEDM
jgi:hypothetical protein